MALWRPSNPIKLCMKCSQQLAWCQGSPDWSLFSVGSVQLGCSSLRDGTMATKRSLTMREWAFLYTHFHGRQWWVTHNKAPGCPWQCAGVWSVPQGRSG